MHSSRLLPLLVIASLGVAARAEDHHPYVVNYTCSPTWNYTDDSPYGKNLAELLSTLSTPAPATVDNWWFRSRTVGTGPNQASGLAMCYADSVAERCLSCLAMVSPMRYADAPFLSSADSDDSAGARLVLRSILIATDPSGMRETRRALLSQLAERAGAGGDALRFATGSQGYVDVTGLRRRHVMYGMAQCPRDLPLSQCTSCLLDHLAAMYRDESAINSTSASVMGLSCYLTYQLDKPIHIAGIGRAQAPSPAPTTAEEPPPTGSSSSAPPSPINRTTKTLFATLAVAAGAVTLLNLGV